MAETPSTSTTYAHAGGFIPPSQTLPSPAPSSASSRVAARLPHQRSKPLIPGSRKEDYARDYVAQRLLHISRRYVKKHGIPDPADLVSGYKGMDEVCRDLEEVIDVLWFSGTPSLQIPYLLNVALAFNTYLPSFTPSPRPTFALLKKLDHCFASLLVGHDVKTWTPLPGFQQRGLSAGLSKTEMVRCKSLADETRMLVAVVMSGEADVEDYEEEDEDNMTANAPPAKPRTEARMGPPQTHNNEIETVKTEDMEEDEDDYNIDSDSGIDKGGARPSTKRKPDAADLPDEHAERKRIKVEEGEDAGPVFGDAAHADESTEPVNGSSASGLNSGDGGQFHWALDDDSDDEALPNTTGATRQEDEEQTVAADDDNDDQRSEVDEEEEELHLNVARVYEKTLVQLGPTRRGESTFVDHGFSERLVRWHSAGA
ncbi:Uu.00g103840.m01.CDS01 [Anthostomella pinea]|uniref:Uu.00g103840.m01.CDS01 n=1 Tax=Anthostomella pinea TaxID=933095 RepID=A0AAI8V8J2_9PEZI|nr:Uu.00g103840.m01.CDS01 [Anthostomella pinea]